MVYHLKEKGGKITFSKCTQINRVDRLFSVQNDYVISNVKYLSIIYDKYERHAIDKLQKVLPVGNEIPSNKGH